MKPWYASSADKPHGSPQRGDNIFTFAGDVVYQLSAPTSSDRPLNGTETWNMKDVQLIFAEKVDKVPVLNLDAFIMYGARTEKVHDGPDEPLASAGSGDDNSGSGDDDSSTSSGSGDDDLGTGCFEYKLRLW